jgi:hypothetical protein
MINFQIKISISSFYGIIGSPSLARRIAGLDVRPLMPYPRGMFAAAWRIASAISIDFCVDDRLFKRKAVRQFPGDF